MPTDLCSMSFTEIRSVFHDWIVKVSNRQIRQRRAWKRANEYLTQAGLDPVTFDQWQRIDASLRDLTDEELAEVARTGVLP